MKFNFLDIDIIIEFFKSNTSYGSNPPAFTDVLTANAGLLGVFIILSLVSMVGIYLIWVKIYGQKGATKSLIPFYNLFMLFRAVELNPYFSIPVILPIIGILPLALFNYYLPRAFGLKGPLYGVGAIFFPWVMLLVLGADKKYEYQYIKGKNVPFKDSFRIMVPGEAGYSNQTDEAEAVGSQVSKAAALNMEMNAKLRAELAAKEQEKAASVAQPVVETKKADSGSEVVYDIFDNGTNLTEKPIIDEAPAEPPTTEDTQPAAGPDLPENPLS